MDSGQLDCSEQPHVLTLKEATHNIKNKAVKSILTG